MGITQAGLGSYLQCSVIQVASLFGPVAVSATMQGQAAVAVVVSGIQVISAIGSIWTEDNDPSSKAAPEGGDPASRSASVFFTISALFMVATMAGHTWLANTPDYQSVTAPLERRKYGGGTVGETTGLVSRGRDEHDDHKSRLFRILKVNALYEIAVALVFTVTLVRRSFYKHVPCQSHASW